MLEIEGQALVLCYTEPFSFHRQVCHSRLLIQSISIVKEILLQKGFGVMDEP